MPALLHVYPLIARSYAPQCQRIMRRIALALLLTGIATAATAQSIGEPLPGRAAPRDAFSKPNAPPP